MKGAALNAVCSGWLLPGAKAVSRLSPFTPLFVDQRYMHPAPLDQTAAGPMVPPALHNPRPRFARCARALSQWHERRRGTSSLTDPVRNNWLDDHMEQIEGSLREMDPTLLDVRQKLVKLFDKEQVPLLHQAYVWSGNNQDSPFSL